MVSLGSLNSVCQTFFFFYILNKTSQKPQCWEDKPKCWGDIFWGGVWMSGRSKKKSQSILASVCYSVCCWVTSICSSGDCAISHAAPDYAKHASVFPDFEQEGCLRSRCTVGFNEKKAPLTYLLDIVKYLIQRETFK